MEQHCPDCGSGQVASRRALFRRWLADQAMPDAFCWYDCGRGNTCPPMSWFVLLALAALALAVPLVVLALFTSLPLLAWLPLFIAVMTTCIVIDLELTWLRYKSWAAQWLCGDCRRVFVGVGKS